MSKPAYNIIEISLPDYLKYHWERTADARRKVGLTHGEFKMIWEKNFWIEYACALEQELRKTKQRLGEILKEKLDEM